MALLADFALFGGSLAALVVALLAGFHRGFTAGLLVISGAEIRDAGEGKRTNCNGQY